MAEENDVKAMASLLSTLTQPNTDAIRQAEAALKPILKDPRCVAALLEILKSTATQPVGVRHVAAVLLRKRIGGHYNKFDPPTKAFVKTELLNILPNEPERTVRHGAACVAAVIAKLEVGSPQSAGGGGGWAELFQFISVTSDPSTSSPEARELSFFMLGEMTETVAEHMRDQLPSLAQLFAAALSAETPSTVQKSALKSLGMLMSYLADEDDDEDALGKYFAGLVPSVLTIAAQCQQRGDDDTVSTILDVLYDLAYCPSEALSTHISLIVQFALHCLADANLEMGVRDSAALVIATLAEAKPKTLAKSDNVVESVVETLFNLIENSSESAAGALFEHNPAWREDYEEDGGNANDDDSPMDSPTATGMAQGTLDMLACELPKKYIFNPVVSRCVARLSSPHANHRKAGIACLGVIAEGCSEPLREHLSDVMNHVFAAAGDSDAQVRECACFCLGQLSEHCQPEILSYSAQILPIVFGLLDDNTVAVQATSCYVLEMFCERLEPEGVRPLLDSLVRKLVSMLEVTTKRSVQEMAVAALAATAVAAEEEFIPYISHVAALMMKLMELSDEKMYTLRGRALECMGHMAIAVGKEAFRPYFSPTMKCACEGLALDSTDLHEFAYAVFANLAKVMGEEFSSVLTELVPHLVTVIATDDGQLEEADEEKDGQFNALDDSEDEDGDGGRYVLNVRTALFESKKGATTAIAEMAAHTGAAFVPHLEPCMEVLQKACKNWHPLIRSEAAQALPNMVVPSVVANHGGEIAWEKGEIAGPNPMSPHTLAVVSAVLTELVALMDDDDKDTVGNACEGIQSVIELCGPHALLLVASECLEKTHNLLSRKAPCQMNEELAALGIESEPGVTGELLDEDDDHDTFMTAVCDLVGAFARVMGSHFAQYLGQFLPPLCAYAKTSRPPSDRSMSIGCLGEIAQELGGSIASHWPTVFMPVVLAGLADEDDNVKRNAAFTTGVCCEGMGEAIAPQYPQLLQAISPLFQVDVNAGDSSAACVDNAAAAVSRMIMTCPTSVPMAQVLPVVLSSLPLKNDMTENDTVYNCLLSLINANQPDAVTFKAEIGRVFTEATAEGSKVEDEIKAKLAAALPALA